MLQTNLKALAN